MPYLFAWIFAVELGTCMIIGTHYTNAVYMVTLLAMAANAQCPLRDCKQLIRSTSSLDIVMRAISIDDWRLASLLKCANN
jgi:hypothetical protein